jgi:RHS repeat-associated protein
MIFDFEKRDRIVRRGSNKNLLLIEVFNTGVNWLQPISVDLVDISKGGKLISVTKNNASTYFAYTGKLTDKVNGLQWNINRWYDSEVGKWVSEYPIEFRSRDINLYRYTRNLFVSYHDFLGLTDPGACQDKCVVGERTNIEQVSFTLRKLHGLSPEARDAGMEAAQNALLLTFIAEIGQTSVTCTSMNIAATLADGITFFD